MLWAYSRCLISGTVSPVFASKVPSATGKMASISTVPYSCKDCRATRDKYTSFAVFWSRNN